MLLVLRDCRLWGLPLKPRAACCVRHALLGCPGMPAGGVRQLQGWHVPPILLGHVGRAAVLVSLP